MTRTTAGSVDTSANKERDAAMEFVPMFYIIQSIVASVKRHVHLGFHVRMGFVGMVEV